MTNGASAIYVLADPDTREVRYVGQSVNPRRRYNLHMTKARKGSEYPVHDWIRSLIDKGKKPLMSVEIVVSQKHIDAFEMAYISVLRSDKYRLLNVTDGGSVPMRGKTFSDEHRRKLSEAHTGRKASEEARRHMSEARKGVPLSEEHKKKLSEARTGHAVTEETRRKLSVARKGIVFSEETLQKLSDSHMGQVAWNKGLTGIPHPHIGHHVPRNRKPKAVPA